MEAKKEIGACQIKKKEAMSDQLKKMRDEWRTKYAEELLTQAQVDRLPDGAEVEIVWSGGNGPHRYVIHRDERFDGPLAWTGRDGEHPLMGGITFVGSERYHTQVRLISLSSEPSAKKKSHQASRRARRTPRPR